MVYRTFFFFFLIHCASRMYARYNGNRIHWRRAYKKKKKNSDITFNVYGLIRGIRRAAGSRRGFYNIVDNIVAVLKCDQKYFSFAFFSSFIHAALSMHSCW